jgi:hypothetical protein
MIRHIVFWRLFGESEGFDKRVSVDIFINELEKLPKQIDEIQSFTIGVNVLESVDSADIVLESSFNTLDDLKAYQAHPAHLAFIKKINHLRYERRVVDYKI